MYRTKLDLVMVNQGMKWHINCNQATQLAGEQMDRKLSFKEKTALRIHLFYCKACRRFERQIKSIETMVRKLKRQFDGEDQKLSKESLDAMKQKLSKLKH